MRILASNPDTLGDLVLRQPLYAALAEAGHELMLAVRPIHGPVVGQVAKGAKVLPIPVNPHDPRLDPETEALDHFMAEAVGFAPDMLLVAPFQWTIVEELLAKALDGVRVAAMSGRLFTEPHYEKPRPSGLLITDLAEVDEDAPELLKNRRLARAVLGQDVKLPDPELEPEEGQTTAAEAVLSRLDLEAGEYWIACVGDGEFTELRNWKPDQWAQLLSEWVGKRNRRFLFVGSEEEQETTRAIRAAMGEADQACAEWIGSGNGQIETLIGLIGLSAGYVGRDTGPMHLAAAMKKPVLALFGGGSWPRFLPAVDPSYAITVGVPCAGCGWRCHLPASYCVKEVPVDEMLRAAEMLESGRVKNRKSKVLRPNQSTLVKIGREGARMAINQRGELATLHRDMRSVNLEAKQATHQNEHLIREIKKTLDKITNASQREADVRTRQLEASVSQLRQSLAARHAELVAAKDQLVQSNTRVAYLEERLEKQGADLLLSKEEAAGARERSRAVEVKLGEHIGAVKAKAQHAQLKAEELESVKKASESVKLRLKTVEQERDAALEDLKAIQLKLGETETALEQFRQSEAQQRQRLVDLEDSSVVNSSRIHDLEIKFGQSSSARDTLATLSKQQEVEVKMLRGRLHDLLASRWRKLGRRIGIAKTLPWERQAANGRKR